MSDGFRDAEIQFAKQDVPGVSFSPADWETTLLEGTGMRDPKGILSMEADPLTLPIEERPVIYVAGYYSASPAHGLANAMKAFQPLVDAGWVPLVPHVSFLTDVCAPNTPEFWYAYDLALLARCDAMYVCGDELTKASTGVQEEIRFAVKNDIPVFFRDIPLASERYDR